MCRRMDRTSTRLSIAVVAALARPSACAVLQLQSAVHMTPVPMPRAQPVKMMQYPQQGFTQSYGDQQGDGTQQGYGAQQAYGGQQGYGGQQDNGAQVIWCASGATGQFCLQPGGEQILGRFDMSLPKNTVSRQQCMVKSGYDGSATVVALGKPLTGWRAGAGTAWQWLRKDDERALFQGAQLSLDQNNPEADVFTIQKQEMGGYGQQQGGYGQPQQQVGGYPGGAQGYPGGAQGLPAGWSAAVDQASGQTYYYNEQTGQSQWEPPQH